MLRSISLLLLLPLVFGASGAFAQTKKSSSPGKIPTAKDSAISVIVYMRDANKNEVLLGTRIWPDYPDYDALVLQRFFAAMKTFASRRYAIRQRAPDCVPVPRTLPSS